MIKLPEQPIIYLDNSVKSIRKYREKYSIKINQFKTPLTRYSFNQIPFILDNGAYSGFILEKFYTYCLPFIDCDVCQFIVIPDVVFDHKKTKLLFNDFVEKVDIPIPKRAFVAQNGATIENIDWNSFGCLFIGGDDKFKDNKGIELAKFAKSLDKWVHVGRLNSPNRLEKYWNYCHSFDGSGLARFDFMLEKMVDKIKSLSKFKQVNLFDERVLMGVMK